jgi:hypothetical protein
LRSSSAERTPSASSRKFAATIARSPLHCGSKSGNSKASVR